MIVGLQSGPKFLLDFFPFLEKDEDEVSRSSSASPPSSSPPDSAFSVAVAEAEAGGEALFKYSRPSDDRSSAL